MKSTTWKIVTMVGIAIVAIATIEVVALLRGVDGALMATVIAAIAALASGAGVKVYDTRNGRKDDNG